MDEEPPYHISIRTDGWDGESPDAFLRTVVETALRRHKIDAADLEIAVVSDQIIAELNQRFLSHEGPTDVLTFDLGPPSQDRTFEREAQEASKSVSDGGAAQSSIEGQIVVSFETARREAAARGHPMLAELGLYVVHGVLHLLGYDDHEETDARRMHELEDELLQAAGVGRVFDRRCG